MKKNLLFGHALAAFILLAGPAAAQRPEVMGQPTSLGEKTSFQTGSAWKPEIDVRSDIAMIYGTGDRKGMSFEQRVKSWRDRGYNTQFMTGIAWGEYADYFLGKWDGKNHQEIGQVAENGEVLWHGGGVPYIVPVESFLEYMKTAVIKRVIDAGITSIYLEEPEFWARGGYGDVFKREWQKFYGFEWRAQHDSPGNTYLSNKLKYHLYYNAIKQVSEYAKRYGKSKGVEVKVYIPTHSLVNYSSLGIVSPEASLASLPGIDGYIAQVWTGTARMENFYNGRKRERVFENAFLEYGSMVSMTAPTGRKMYLLTDPVEDWPRDWADYKRNYEATFTAKLMYPTVNNYEVMPWPERIYMSPYKLADGSEEVLIPKPYATQMQVMVNALNYMPISDHQVSGVNSIGVLMGNSMMFQRFPEHKGYTDPLLSNFYGQTMPLLKKGVPVKTVHMENLVFANTLKDIKVLVMSYANMKPYAEEVHQYLADWVRGGGVLVFCGADDDPYQLVPEWWNAKGRNHQSPSGHLFALMGQENISSGSFAYGRGIVHVIRKDPKEFVLSENGDAQFLRVHKQAFETNAKAGKLVFKNSLYLERGAYDIVAVLDEHDGGEAFRVPGPVIDLFDPALPVLKEKVVAPGQQAVLLSLKRVMNRSKPQVLAAAARISSEVHSIRAYSIVCKAPANTVNAMRFLLPGKPENIEVKVRNLKLPFEMAWDDGSQTLFLSFDNQPEGVSVSVTW